MPQTNQDKTGILLPNSFGRTFSSSYPAGNRPAANYNLLFKDDFSSGTVGNGYTGFHASTVYANDHPYLGGKALRVNLGTMNPPTCGGAMNYGGRINLPQSIPYGSRVWYSARFFHPSTRTWGYCYDSGDNAEAVACGKESDGNEWTKFMVLAPTTGTARIYVQPKAARRTVTQQLGMRVYSEESQTPDDNNSIALPLDQWHTLQVEVLLSTSGYLRVWLDNTVIMYVDCATVSSGNSIAQWGIGDYWNGCPYTDGGANRSHFWMKDVMIATNAAGFTAPTDTDGSGNIFIAPTRIPRDFS